MLHLAVQVAGCTMYTVLNGMQEGHANNIKNAFAMKETAILISFLDKYAAKDILIKVWWREPFIATKYLKLLIKTIK